MLNRKLIVVRSGCWGGCVIRSLHSVKHDASSSLMTPSFYFLRNNDDEGIWDQYAPHGQAFSSKQYDWLITSTGRVEPLCQLFFSKDGKSNSKFSPTFWFERLLRKVCIKNQVIKFDTMTLQDLPTESAERYFRIERLHRRETSSVSSHTVRLRLCRTYQRTRQ
jgi:hypothetical protein